eukprot:PhM_4_TR13925/c2_g1_i1/m.100618
MHLREQRRAHGVEETGEELEQLLAAFEVRRETTLAVEERALRGPVRGPLVYFQHSPFCRWGGSREEPRLERPHALRLDHLPRNDSADTHHDVGVLVFECVLSRGSLLHARLEQLLQVPMLRLQSAKLSPQLRARLLLLRDLQVAVGNERPHARNLFLELVAGVGHAVLELLQLSPGHLDVLTERAVLSVPLPVLLLAHGEGAPRQHDGAQLCLAVNLYCACQDRADLAAAVGALLDERLHADKLSLEVAALLEVKPAGVALQNVVKEVVLGLVDDALRTRRHRVRHKQSLVQDLQRVENNARQRRPHRLKRAPHLLERHARARDRRHVRPRQRGRGALVDDGAEDALELVGDTFREVVDREAVQVFGHLHPPVLEPAVRHPVREPRERVLQLVEAGDDGVRAAQVRVGGNVRRPARGDAQDVAAGGGAGPRQRLETLRWGEEVEADAVPIVQGAFYCVGSVVVVVVVIIQ